MKTIFLFLILFPSVCFSACVPSVRLWAYMDFKNLTWKTFRLESTTSPRCQNPHPRNPTHEVIFVKGKKKYVAQIEALNFMNFDYQTKTKKIAGGMTTITGSQVFLWVPGWVRGSDLTVIEISSKNKVLGARL